MIGPSAPGIGPEGPPSKSRKVGPVGPEPQAEGSKTHNRGLVLGDAGSLRRTQIGPSPRPASQPGIARALGAPISLSLES
ncbi:hypothetical protein AK812_SmicGene44351 [Symbiodinium microadriaticum]|uniref:Uncharacterized protein n=1 Tax=Symbiodinium microadriaticum TaxID=2951 RepID=A0A1Q9BYR9_SYMMI|nr:hypothetical protein AK812_SmicGene44351 [Symbiodinium microadriaticum]